MALTRTRQGSRNNSESLETTRPQSVNSIRKSYSKLPENEITHHHEKHFADARKLLWDALSTYSDQRDAICSKSRISENDLNRATRDFYKVVESARDLDFPAKDLKHISFGFIDASLNHDINFSPPLRKAIKDMGLAIGGDKVSIAKAQRIGEHYAEIIKTSPGRSFSQAQLSSIDMANDMLTTLGKSIDVEYIPSVAVEIAELTKEHGRKIALTGAAALISTSVLVPSIVNARETPATNTAVSVGATVQNSNNNANLVIEMPTAETKSPVAVSVSAPSETPSSSSIEVGVALSTETKVDKQQEPVSISTAPNTRTVEATVTVPVVSDTERRTQEKPTIAVTHPSPEVSTKPETAVNTENIGLPEAPELVDGEPVPVKPIAAVNERVNDTPKLDEKKSTREQLAIQQITDTINNDGDIDTATSLIRLYFHVGNDITVGSENKKAVYQTTNPELIKNIRDLGKTYEDLIATKGHVDVNYINTTLTALAVFQAAVEDQTVLLSPEVQQLLDGVKRPDDEYQGKLYDEYIKKAQATLTANNGALLKDVNGKLAEKIESVYAYTLLANVNDDDQKAEIDAIKAEEKKADEEAAKAAADAAAAQGRFDPSEVEAIAADPNRLLLGGIDRAASAFGWLDTKLILMKEFAVAGAPLGAAAGAAGNAYAESKYNPGIEEETTRLQKGYGYFQWTFDRRTWLENKARNAGVSSADPIFQAQMAVEESKTRTMRDNPSANEWAGLIAITDPAEAAGYWRWNFERPDEKVSHADKRVIEAQQIFNEVSGQMEAIKQEAATATAARAAAEAAHKAEAERIAAEEARKAESSIDIDMARLFEDSTVIACAAGTNDAGTETGYNRGRPIAIRLCELPNTYETEGDRAGRPVVVNSRVSAAALAMFANMAKDLGLDKIAFNDSFRTMGEQIRMKEIYGKQAADPGFSNHQLGTALDVNMGPKNGNDRNVTYIMNVNNIYPGSPPWEWMDDFAEGYGFVQIDNEGWHWQPKGA